MDKIDRQELSWPQMSALIDGLIDDHTSHTFASAAGWSYVPSPAEVAFYDELDVKLAMNRGKNQPRPSRVERPWEKGKPKQFLAAAHDPERAKRRERLNEMLGL